MNLEGKTLTKKNAEPCCEPPASRRRRGRDFFSCLKLFAAPSCIYIIHTDREGRERESRQLAGHMMYAAAAMCDEGGGLLSLALPTPAADGCFLRAAADVPEAAATARK